MSSSPYMEGSPDGVADPVPLPTPPASVTPTQPLSSRSPSPRAFDDVLSAAVPGSGAQKKKKKKKPKKKAKEDTERERSQPQLQEPEKPAVLCISRNKHWRYISSYHVSVVWSELHRLIADTSVFRGRGYNFLWSC